MSATEMWKDIPDFKGYQISTHGRVRLSENKYRKNVGDILKQTINSSGYYIVSLYKESKVVTPYIHRLVMLTFYGDSKKQVRHLNGNKLDNRLLNLRYGTAKQNAYDRELHGNTARGQLNGFSKLTPKQIKDIRHRFIKYCKVNGGAAIARDYDLSVKHVHNIINKKVWNHI